MESIKILDGYKLDPAAALAEVAISEHLDSETLYRPYDPGEVEIYDRQEASEEFSSDEGMGINAVKPKTSWRMLAPNDRLKYPARINGKLIFEFWGDNNSQAFVEGSGTLIGPNHVITAAHNLFIWRKDASGKFTHKGWANRVTFYPACSETNNPNVPHAPYGKFPASVLCASPKFIDMMLPQNGMKTNWDEDWGMIVLAVPPRMGWMNAESVTDNDLMRDNQTLFAYPYDNHVSNVPADIKGKGKWNMWTDSGKPFNCSALNYGHHLDVWIGMSGAGLYTDHQPGPSVRGIQSSHVLNTPNGPTGNNYAVRITYERIQQYNEWLKIQVSKE